MHSFDSNIDQLMKTQGRIASKAHEVGARNERSEIVEFIDSLMSGDTSGLTYDMAINDILQFIDEREVDYLASE